MDTYEIVGIIRFSWVTDSRLSTPGNPVCMSLERQRKLLKKLIGVSPFEGVHYTLVRDNLPNVDSSSKVSTALIINGSGEFVDGECTFGKWLVEDVYKKLTPPCIIDNGVVCIKHLGFPDDIVYYTADMFRLIEEGGF